MLSFKQVNVAINLDQNHICGDKMENPKVSRMWNDLQKATSRLVFHICFADEFARIMCAINSDCESTFPHVFGSGYLLIRNQCIFVCCVFCEI